MTNAISFLPILLILAKVSISFIDGKRYFKHPCGVPTIKPSVNLNQSFIQPVGIEGSEEAVPHSYPWQVEIYFNDPKEGWIDSCGGSVLSDTWVLTAAHCIKDGNASDYILKFGAHVLGKSRFVNPNEILYQQIRKAKEILRHPSYKRESHDVGLIKLKRKIRITDFVSPICLPFDVVPLAVGQKMAATGFGLVNETYPSPYLKQIVLSVVNQTLCTAFGADESMFCAKPPDMINGTCEGGSGGALATNQLTGFDSNGGRFLVSGAWIVYGINSYRNNCVTRGFDFFSNVEYVLGWIRNNTQIFQVEE